MKDLSRALSVSKQFDRTILDSMELRRTLFLEPEPAREYLEFMRGRDQRCYDVWNSSQPVVVRRPLGAHEFSQNLTRVIVQPQNSLWRVGDFYLEDVNAHEVRMSVSDFQVFRTAPPSAFLFQPPLDNVTIANWGRRAQLEIPGGVTFGAVVQAIEKIRAATKELIVRSPRFAERLCGLEDQMSLAINASGAVVDGVKHVRTARLASVRARQLAISDEYLNGSA